MAINVPGQSQLLSQLTILRDSKRPGCKFKDYEILACLFLGTMKICSNFLTFPHIKMVPVIKYASYAPFY